MLQLQKKLELALKEIEIKSELKVHEIMLEAETKLGIEEYKINTQAQVDLANGEKASQKDAKENEDGMQEGKEAEKEVTPTIPNIIINMPSGNKTITMKRTPEGLVGNVETD